MTDCFVVDEWLLHDLAGENTKDAQRRALVFLEALKARCDRIAALRDSPWIKKAYALMKLTSILVRDLSKYLRQAILLDPNKFHFIDRSKVSGAAEAMRNVCPQDDFYLIETYFAATAKALITADQGLHDAFRSSQDVVVRLKADFLSEYLN